MTIAFHFSPVEAGDIFSNSLSSTILRFVIKNPAHHFIFLFDGAVGKVQLPANVTAVASSPVIRNMLLKHYFYNYKVPGILKKNNVDIFITEELCSLRTKVAQVFFVTDVSFLEKRNTVSKNRTRYFRRFFPAFAKKSAQLVVPDETMKNILLRQYPVTGEKTVIIPPAVQPSFTALAYNEAETVREEFTNGRQYFIFFVTAASQANCIMVLKAFSIFKKWQKSDMKMLLLLPENFDEKYVSNLETYKYRDDVKLVPPSEISGKHLAAAYAALHLPDTGASEIHGLCALTCGVPLITSDNDLNKSKYGDAAIFAPADEKILAEKIILLYKDERMRNRYIEAATQLSLKHHPEMVLQQLDQLIQLAQTEKILPSRKWLSHYE